MQQSCITDPSKYDCTKGLRLLNIIDVSAKVVIKNLKINGGNLTDLTIPRLFANCDCGNSEYENKLHFGMAPNPQLFKEDFPSNLDSTGWELYSTKTYKPFGDSTKPLISYAWRGNVTTISNKAYGITAGMNVDLIIIFAAPPVLDSIIRPGKLYQILLF